MSRKSLMEYRMEAYKRSQLEFIQGFMCGVKDAIFLFNDEFGVEILQKSNLPRIEIEAKYNNRILTEHWFFKDESTKEKFMQYNLYEARKDGTFKHKIVGEVLGFPPESVRIFSEDSYTPNDRIGISYCGMQYMSYKESILDDLRFLLSERGEFNSPEFKVSFNFYEDDDSLSYIAPMYFKNFNKIMEMIKTKIEQL